MNSSAGSVTLNTRRLPTSTKASLIMPMRRSQTPRPRITKIGPVTASENSRVARKSENMVPRMIGRTPGGPVWHRRGHARRPSAARPGQSHDPPTPSPSRGGLGWGWGKPTAQCLRNVRCPPSPSRPPPWKGEETVLSAFMRLHWPHVRATTRADRRHRLYRSRPACIVFFAPVASGCTYA
jgi:hypothetical protein